MPQTTVATAWRAEFDAMAEQVARLRAEGRWVRGSQDLLGVIGHDRAELTHSTVLAWLFDPVGAHGLGAGLLRRFLGEVGTAATDVELGRAIISCEVGRPDARADVLIQLPDMQVVIENKIDAGEQPDQCRRLVSAFGFDATTYVFLTLTGYLPATAVDQADLWHACSYRQIAGWLRELTETQPDVTASVRAYLDTLYRITR